jgi:hypothetical protein
MSTPRQPRSRQYIDNSFAHYKLAAADLRKYLRSVVADARAAGYAEQEIADRAGCTNFTIEDLPTLQKLRNVGANMQVNRSEFGVFLEGLCRDLAAEIQGK